MSVRSKLSHERRQIIVASLSWAAAGLLAGLSSVATPAKFLAENVPLEHLLSVGRVTFRALLAAGGFTLLLLVVVAHGRLRWWPVAVAVVLGVQYLLLMPALDVRTLSVMAGAVLPSSPLHGIWILADVLRIGAYTALGVFALGSHSSARR